MLQSLLRQSLGRLNVTRGMVGLSRLPLYANITRGLLTSAPALKEADTSVTKVREVKKKTKAKKVVPKKPKLYKKDVVRPDSIRRPLYGFAKFVQELREKSGSTDSLRALFGEASPKWHALSEQEKQKYGCDPEEMKSYNEKIREWRSSLNNKERKVLGLKIKVTPHPMSAYQMVVREVFKQNPGLPFTETGALVQKKYKSLTEEQKEQYKRDAIAEFNAQQAA
ncbi:hypothetical protein BJ165DRAFT_200570 [Panaeolus papilionaceus]|nr:hypothetical protein BJ165DRAFT_200570 [Panaeolus papilionaceus]